MVSVEINLIVCVPGGGSAETDSCPPGYYCPTGTGHWSDYGCPNGTYNANYGMWQESQCLNCTQGKRLFFNINNVSYLLSLYVDALLGMVVIESK